MAKPKAWSIVDLSENTEAFSISDNHERLRRSFAKGAKGRRKHISAAADEFVVQMSAIMQEDPIAYEYYETILETPTRAGVFSSLHLMLLGGDNKQELHFHPSVDSNPKTSERMVLAFPLFNDKRGEGGITFEWFDTQNTHLVRNLDKGTYPEIFAEPKGNKHSIHLPPGHIGLVKLDAGVHRFFGEGLAISFHPLDIDNNTGLGSFLGNTAAYNGFTPETEEIVPVKFNSKKANNFTESEIEQVRLGRLFTSHIIAFREYAQQRDPRDKFMAKDQEDLAEFLRSRVDIT